MNEKKIFKNNVKNLIELKDQIELTDMTELKDQKNMIKMREVTELIELKKLIELKDIPTEQSELKDPKQTKIIGKSKKIEISLKKNYTEKTE